MPTKYTKKNSELVTKQIVELITGQPDIFSVDDYLGLFDQIPQIPGYVNKKVGDWILKSETEDTPIPIRSYFVFIAPATEVSRLFKGGDIWMSVTPMELESMTLAVNEAFGETVVMGLGMGCVAINMLLNPEVDRITVVERDLALIEAFPDMVEGRTKEIVDDAIEDGRLVLVHSDAFDYQHPCNIDYLYVDIWEKMGAMESEGDTARLCERLKPTYASFWTQELAILHHMMTNATKGKRPPTKADIQRFADDYKIPLKMLDEQTDEWFAKYCRAMRFAGLSMA